MIYKWISLILLLIIIYLLRCYWLPVLKSKNQGSNQIFNSEHIQNNAKLNEEFKWVQSKGIMPFIGSLDYQTSRNFYSEIGFIVEEGTKHCKININENLSFWLQDYSNKKWLDNSMVFLDIPDLKHLKNKLTTLNIETKYRNVKISETKTYDWGNEFFMHDPSGVLWHFCEYKKELIKEKPADNNR
jgi:hypothetical protein